MEFIFYVIMMLPIAAIEGYRMIMPGPFNRTMQRIESIPPEELDKDKIHLSLFALYYIAYCIIGLFSSQWMWFIFIWIVSIITYLLRKTYRDKGTQLTCVDAFLTLYGIAMMEFNKFF